MANKKQYDYLIVGQGLAGSILAYLLLKRGKTVLVLDNAPEFSSSKVAGGLYNPLTGQRITKTWLADLLFPEIEPFYQELETILQAKFLYSMPIYRPFLSDEARELAYARLQPIDIEKYISKDTFPEQYNQYIFNEFGGFITNYCGYLDTATFVEKMRFFLIKKSAYQVEKLNYQEIETTENKISYRDISATKIIFCEGYQVRDNPYFNYVPYAPVKGELLHIEADLPQDFIFNNGSVFIVPLPDGSFRVGATYLWDFPDENTTIEARNQLEINLQKLIKVPYKIIGQNAGIRPAIQGRRPVMGVHYDKNNIFIFNALGAKGVSQAPFWAKHFCLFLEEGQMLNPAIDLKRFESHIPKK